MFDEKRLLLDENNNINAVEDFKRTLAHREQDRLDSIRISREVREDIEKEFKRRGWKSPWDQS